MDSAGRRSHTIVPVDDLDHHQVAVRAAARWSSCTTTAIAAQSRSPSWRGGATSPCSSSSSCSRPCGGRAILRSHRGVKGGYTFARPGTEITVLEIVELLDGPVGAGATGVFADRGAGSAVVLGESTVSDVAEAETRAAGAQCTTSRTDRGYSLPMTPAFRVTTR